MSKKNGTPQFNFRKMGYTYESKMTRIQSELQHLQKQLQNLPPEQEPTVILDQIDVKEREALASMLPIVTYLPEDYLIEGKTSDDINFDDVDSIFDAMCFGAMDRLALAMAQARRDYVKKSTAS